MKEELLKRVDALEVAYASEKSYDTAKSLILAYRELYSFFAGSDPRLATSYLERVENVATELISQGELCLERERIHAMQDASSLALRYKAFGTAQNYLERAISYSEKWVEREETVEALGALCESHDYFGKLALAAGYPQDAISHFEISDKTAFRMLELGCYSEENIFNYITVMMGCAQAQIALRDLDSALKYYQRALDLLNADIQSSARLSVASININRLASDALWHKKAIDSAISHIEAAVKAADKVILVDKSLDTMREAVLSHFSLGQKKDALGDFLAAQASYLRALCLAQENVERYGTPQVKDDLAVAMCTFGEKTLNKNYVADAIAIWQELCMQQPNNSIYAQKKQYGERALARMS